MWRQNSDFSRLINFDCKWIFLFVEWIFCLSICRLLPFETRNIWIDFHRQYISIPKTPTYFEGVVESQPCFFVFSQWCWLHCQMLRKRKCSFLSSLIPLNVSYVRFRIALVQVICLRIVELRIPFWIRVKILSCEWRKLFASEAKRIWNVIIENPEMFTKLIDMTCASNWCSTCDENNSDCSAT